MQHFSSGLLAILTLVTMLGCENQSNNGAKTAQPPVPGVKIAQPLAQDVIEWDEYTGRIEAVSSVDVRARVSGYLEKVNFKAGERVKKGGSSIPDRSQAVQRPAKSCRSGA